MNRLAPTIGLDTRVQARNLLYVIGVTLAVVVGAAAGAVVSVEAIRFWMPAIFVGTVGGSTFVFVAGMVLYEKSEGTINALRVTPLSPSVYLSSKVITLAGFATLECALLFGLAHGARDVNLLALTGGVVGMGALFTLAGFAVAVSYDSITDFLIPWGVLAALGLEMPVIHTLELWSHPIWYVFPSVGSLTLMKGALQPIAPWEWFYGVGYTAVSVIVMHWVALRQCRKHIGWR